MMPRDIPLARVGIISKVSSLSNSAIFGISQSTQPLISCKCGAGSSAFAQAAKRAARGRCGS